MSYYEGRSYDEYKKQSGKTLKPYKQQTTKSKYPKKETKLLQYEKETDKLFEKKNKNKKRKNKKKAKNKHTKKAQKHSKHKFKSKQIAKQKQKINNVNNIKQQQDDNDIAQSKQVQPQSSTSMNEDNILKLQNEVEVKQTTEMEENQTKKLLINTKMMLASNCFEQTSIYLSPDKTLADLKMICSDQLKSDLDANKEYVFYSEQMGFIFNDYSMTINEIIHLLQLDLVNISSLSLNIGVVINPKKPEVSPEFLNDLNETKVNQTKLNETMFTVSNYRPLQVVFNESSPFCQYENQINDYLQKHNVDDNFVENVKCMIEFKDDKLNEYFDIDVLQQQLQNAIAKRRPKTCHIQNFCNQCSSFHPILHQLSPLYQYQDIINYCFEQHANDDDFRYMGDDNFIEYVTNMIFESKLNVYATQQFEQLSPLLDQLRVELQTIVTSDGKFITEEGLYMHKLYQLQFDTEPNMDQINSFFYCKKKKKKNQLT
eukprot:497612_1